MTLIEIRLYFQYYNDSQKKTPFLELGYDLASRAFKRDNIFNSTMMLRFMKTYHNF